MGRAPRRGRSIAGVIAGVIGLGVALATTGARAQSAQDAAAAEVLFEQAKQLMHDKKYGEACAKLAESNRLDAGIGTMLWLGDCYEKNGQTASAWAEFVEAADLAAKKRDERQKVARERAGALEPSLAKLTVAVPLASDVPGLEVRRDGVVVGRAVWGAPVPVDPGQHALIASAPGRRPWQATITVPAAPRTDVVAVPLLEEDRTAATPHDANQAKALAAPSAGATGAGDHPPPRPPASTGVAQRGFGLVLGGLGIVGISVGAVFGLQAKAHLDASNGDGHCSPDNRCDATGTQDRNDALASATASTVAFLAGGALFATGVVLYVASPRASGQSTSVGGAAQGLAGGALIELRPFLDGREAGLSLHARF